MIEFGTKVLVNAEVMRIAATPNVTYYGQIKGSRYYQAGTGLRNRKNWEPSTIWPGEAIEGARETSRVQVRRFVYSAPIRGIVVGHSWLEEGNTDTWQEYSERTWICDRRVPVIQVAVQGPRGAVRILNVLEQDLQVES